MARPSGGGPSGRERLLDAVWRMLEEHPDARALTVAAVCDRAGCTPPTLYHHFADLAALVAAASSRAFAAWAAQVEHEIGAAHSAQHGGEGPGDAGHPGEPDRAACADLEPAQRLRRRGAAYVAWGVAHPAAYRALFLTPGMGGGDGPGHGFRELLADLAALAGTSPSDPALLPRALAHWSAVHGLTCLAITVPDLPTGLRDAAYDQLSGALTPGSAS